MKKLLVVLMIVALVMVFAAPAMAHPKGPDSMPAQSLGGLHRAVVEVPEFPQHIVVGLMLRTGLYPGDGHCPFVPED